MEKEAQLWAEVVGRDSVLLIKEGEHFTSILNIRTINEIMSKVSHTTWLT
jgi:hypothetical protein